MSEDNIEIIKYIEKCGLVRDIDDNVWYGTDYKQRVVPSYYCYHNYHIYYENGFKNAIRFNNLEELKNLLKK